MNCRGEDPDGTGPEDEDIGASQAGSGLPTGYAWTFEEQEQNLPEAEYHLHRAILDEYDEVDLEAFDPDRRSDYVLWAAAQALEELERSDAALEVLRRIAASRTPHPALYYPDILLRLGEHLRDRGSYEEALGLIVRIETEEPDLGDVCLERRAEILVLSGELKKGEWLFEKAANRAPDDPWLPITAAWALLQRGEYGRIAGWLERAAKALRDLSDEDQAREAASEIDRLKEEAGARQKRRDRGGALSGEAGPSGSPIREPADLHGRREAILADVDSEEVRLVGNPPRDDAARGEAARRVAALHARASRAWDDAVEAGDEEMIAAFDDLQWEIVGLAERFGVPVPGEAGD